MRRSSRSGGSAVVTVFGSTPARSVGFRDGIARSPTAGAAVRFRTTTFPSAWIVPAADRLREQPVGPGRRGVDGGDVDVLRVRLRATGHADRLERRRRLGVRLLLSALARPRPAPSALDQPGLLVDDEERDAVLARPVVGRAGDDGDVLTGRTPERLQASRRRCGRRCRVGSGAVAGAPAAAEDGGATERDKGRSGANTARV